MSLNLASQPFVNSRPVRRLVLVLWCLSLVLIAANVFFYTLYFSGQQDRRDRLAALSETEERERDRLAELELELGGFDVEWQNRQVDFLNLRIAERVFPWSRLFDRLAEALPPQVRLTRLRPLIEGLSAPGGGFGETVQLEIRAEARSEEAMLGFLEQLFEHPAFRDPNLSSENRSGTNITEFALTVIYLPARAADAAAAAAEPAADAVPELAEEARAEESAP